MDIFDKLSRLLQINSRAGIWNKPCMDMFLRYTDSQRKIGIELADTLNTTREAQNMDEISIRMYQFPVESSLKNRCSYTILSCYAVQSKS